MTDPQAETRWIEFARACGLMAPVRLRVVDSRTGSQKELERRGPTLLVGSREDCDICLIDPEISRRHAWLQVIDGQLACIDLDSRTGIHWGHNTRSRGWVLPGQPVQIGPYELTLLDAVGGERPAVHADTRFSLWDSPGDSTSDTGLVFLNAHSRTGERRICRLTRRLTLIGGSDLCNLRLQHGSVERVHAALVTLGRRAWLLDLRSEIGVQVTDRSVPLACLSPKDEVRIGKFHLVVAPLHELPQLAEESSPEGESSPSSGGFPAGGATGGSPATGGLAPRGLTRRGRRKPQGLRPLNAGEGLAEIPGQPPASVGDAATLHMLEQMQRMQQQYLEHTAQMMSMVVQAFGSAHNRQLDVIRDELHRVHELNRELQELQARRESSQPEEAGANAGTASATTPPPADTAAGTPRPATAEPPPPRNPAPPPASNPAGPGFGMPYPAPVFNPAIFPPGVVPAGFVPPAYPVPGYGPGGYPAPNYPGMGYPSGPAGLPPGWMPPPGPGMFPPPPPLRPKPRPATTPGATAAGSSPGGTGAGPAGVPGGAGAPGGTGPAAVAAGGVPPGETPAGGTPEDPLAQAAHLDLSSRISELEQERTTRWQRVLQMLTGSGGT